MSPLAILRAALLTVAIASPPAMAQATPYYNPANPASHTGLTTGHELFRTIGCPGRGILDAPCPAPVAAQPAARPAPAPEPDSDGDGVVDRLDQCPDTPRGARVDARGCELDSDGDGVIDRLDQCPDTPRGARVDARGCELDSDGDGVVDRLDRCPDTPTGTAVDQHGCPKPVIIELRGVHFDNDMAVLRPDARVILDAAVTTLRQNPGIRVEIAGHTDGVGTDAHNLDLSQRRAQAVLDYFVARGIAADRLSARGYGKSEPIADNDTAEGRAANRRVELRVRP
jgi:OOP family OmpA-OmpF porin